MKMAIIGIVAEYNPFHTGHARHIALTRSPEDTVICCMSGHFVQRGDCAITDKWQRTSWALMRGADLVLELPTRFALSSAEGFARGAVQTLLAAGITHLSFGCEQPDLTALRALAAALNHPDYQTQLKPYLVGGVPFPLARQRWLAEKLGKETAALLSTPNNALAVEYLRFLPPDVTPLPIPRTGAHDAPWIPASSAPPSAPPSASALRRRLREGENVDLFLPSPFSGPIYDLKYAERAIFSTLRGKTLEELSADPDSGEGLSHRLFFALKSAKSLDELFFLTKSRHITLARVRRVVVRNWLGFGWEKGGKRAGKGQDEVEYLRVLGMTARGAAHLKALKSVCPLPILTKPAAHRALLAEEARLTDQFALCAPEIRPSGEEFRHSPIFF